MALLAFIAGFSAQAGTINKLICAAATYDVETIKSLNIMELMEYHQQEIVLVNGESELEFKDKNLTQTLSVSAENENLISLSYQIENSLTSQRDHYDVYYTRSEGNEVGINTENNGIGMYLTREFLAALKKYEKQNVPTTIQDAINFGKLIERYSHSRLSNADNIEIANLSEQMMKLGLLKKESSVLMVLGSSCQFEEK